MGIIKLRDKDKKRARSEKWSDPLLCDFKTVGAMDAYCRAVLKHEFGVTLDEKGDWRVDRWARMTTAYHNKLKLSEGFDELQPEIQAALLAHEIVHYRQRRQFGRHRFNSKYLFSARWRMSVEIPAYREEVRVLAILGARRGQLESYIDEIVKGLKSYTIGVLDFKSLKKLATNTLSKELP